MALGESTRKPKSSQVGMQLASKPHINASSNDVKPMIDIKTIRSLFGVLRPAMGSPQGGGFRGRKSIYSMLINSQDR